MEGLAQVVVRARLQSGHPIASLVSSREDDDGQPLAGAADVAQDLDAAASGQAEVEDDEVEVVVAGEGRAGDPVRSYGRGVPRGAQALLEESGQPDLIFDDQDPAHGTGRRRSPTARPGSRS